MGEVTDKQHRRMTADVPALIAAAGEPAVRAYREFLADPARSPATRKMYAVRARRFFRWAESRGLALEMIDAKALAAYADEIAATKSQMEASIYLTPVRGLLGHLARSGVLPSNSCPTGQPNGRGHPVSASRCDPRPAAPPPPIEHGPDQRPEPAPRPGPVGFPLLDLLAMLGNMEERTLDHIFDEAAIALALLEQVRWPDGPRCPHCGTDAGDDPPAHAVCAACAKPYGVTTGTMFEGSPLPVRLWSVVIHQMYLAEPRLPDEELRRRFGLDLPAVLSLCRRIGEAVVQQAADR